MILDILGFILLVESIHIETVPSQGSPPDYILLSSSIYDNYTSSIFIIGGKNSVTYKETSEIYTYNLSSNKWGTVVPESNYIPSGLQYHYLFLNSNRVILSFFGIENGRYLSEVPTFDLTTLTWNKAQLTGDHITGRAFYGACNFIYNNTEYVAIYGGWDRDGFQGSLYL